MPRALSRPHAVDCRCESTTSSYPLGCMDATGSRLSAVVPCKSNGT